MTRFAYPVRSATGEPTIGATRALLAEGLGADGVPSSWTDAGALVAYACGVPYNELAKRARDGVTAAAFQRILSLAARRGSGEPLQLIVGTAPFVGLELGVGPGVFIPRPETEGLALLAEDAINHRREPVIIDLCAGVGPLAIYLATRFPDARVFAVENQADALSLLAANAAAAARVRIEIVASDVTDAALTARLPVADLVVANPPYIKSSDIPNLPREVRDWEPRAALDGGADGLAFYPAIIGFARARLAPGGALALEIGEDAADAVTALCADFESVEVHRDLAGRDRYVVARKGLCV